jgi:hypothetical protein
MPAREVLPHLACVLSGLGVALSRALPFSTGHAAHAGCGSILLALGAAGLVLPAQQTGKGWRGGWNLGTEPGQGGVNHRAYHDQGVSIMAEPTARALEPAPGAHPRSPLWVRTPGLTWEEKVAQAGPRPEEDWGRLLLAVAKEFAEGILTPRELAEVAVAVAKASGR